MKKYLYILIAFFLFTGISSAATIDVKAPICTVGTNGQSISAGATVYGMACNGAGATATEAFHTYSVLYDLTVTDICIRSGSNLSATANVVVTLRKNGINTAFTYTVAGGTTAGQWCGTGSVAFTAGDGLSVSFQNTGSTSALNLAGNGIWGFTTVTLPAPAWSDITSKPTTLSGYGITDSVLSTRNLTINGTTYDLSADRSWTVSGGGGTVPWTDITGTPTTLSGYGITDAVPDIREIDINGDVCVLSSDCLFVVTGGGGGGGITCDVSDPCAFTMVDPDGEPQATPFLIFGGIVLFVAVFATMIFYFRNRI